MQKRNITNHLMCLTLICLMAAFLMTLSIANTQAQTVNTPAAQGGASEILSFDNDAQRKIYDDLILELRCPKCQNQNIADSNADIAVDLRKKVYEMALANKDKHEIKQFMLARYGEFVLYKPQFSGKTLLLWLGPLFLLLCVVFFVARLIMRNAAHLDNQETID